jgi:ribulose 1,5-bisphosphate synthetase/thiazole synthase
MKKAIVTLACALLVPLAFAQTSSTGKGHKGQGATTTEPITVTGTIIKTETEAGAGTAASYQPFKTLVVRVDASNNSGRYVLNGTGHVVNKAGEIVHTAITPGTRVRVYYIDTGHSRLVDHVVVEEPPTRGGTAIIF